MHDDLTYRRNWVLHVSRLSLVAEVLADAGLRLGLEYVGPKTFWSTERFPFIHSLSEVRELIADTGAPNVGVILDSFHWYTAGETAADLVGLRDAEIVSVDINDAPDDRDRDEQLDLDRRLPATTGVIDLAGFMTGLQGRRLHRPGQGRAVPEARWPSSRSTTCWPTCPAGSTPPSGDRHRVSLASAMTHRLGSAVAVTLLGMGCRPRAGSAVHGLVPAALALRRGDGRQRARWLEKPVVHPARERPGPSVTAPLRPPRGGSDRWR